MIRMFYFCLGMMFVTFASWIVWHLVAQHSLRSNSTSVEYRQILNDAIRQGQQQAENQRTQTPTVRRRTRPSVETLETRASGQLTTDTSQVFFLIRSSGRTAGTVASQLGLKRDAIKSELDDRGFDDIIFDEIDIKVTENKRYRNSQNQVRRGQKAFLGTMQLSITFHGSPDLVTIASLPVTSRNAEIQKSLFWFSDFDKTLAPLKEIAREKLENMATEKFGERDFEISSIDFKDNIKGHSRKFKQKNVRTVLTAKVRLKVYDDE